MVVELLAGNGLLKCGRRESGSRAVRFLAGRTNGPSTMSQLSCSIAKGDGDGSFQRTKRTASWSRSFPFKARTSGAISNSSRAATSPSSWFWPLFSLSSFSRWFHAAASVVVIAGAFQLRRRMLCRCVGRWRRDGGGLGGFLDLATDFYTRNMLCLESRPFSSGRENLGRAGSSVGWPALRLPRLVRPARGTEEAFAALRPPAQFTS
jgi:hypothetical protein